MTTPQGMLDEQREVEILNAELRGSTAEFLGWLTGLVPPSEKENIPPEMRPAFDKMVGRLTEAAKRYASRQAAGPITTEQLDKLQFGKSLHTRPAAPQGREANSALTKIAAECHRAKWQFDMSGDYKPKASVARGLVAKAFDDLHKIGDMALKLRDALTPAVAPDGAGEWQLVPKEPTKEMIQACIWALDNIARCHGYKLTGLELNEAVRAVVRALRPERSGDAT